MDHLLWNSGDMNSSASACCRLSARATACRVSARHGRPEHRVHDEPGIDAAGDALGVVVGDVQPPAHAVDPGRLVIGIALGRRRAPQRLAEHGLAAGEAGRVRLGDPGSAHHRDRPTRSGA